MKKLFNSLNRLSWSLVLGGALLVGASACSTGTSEGNVNVEESDFKDKSPTEHNAQGTSDNTQDPLNTSGTDSTNQAIYDQQENKIRERNTGTSNQGVGGAAERSTNKQNN
ncbi:hypothetical protein ACD591_12230 [Rufibacter glacialis]|uniref:Lipoprotein n=1 Tax=Rufibacter glacialis TaxID=1259555 RepID=A0A5M8QQI4_9BACT|nr:hypothetical protein [Rufibacter glacialis]KAA6437264.1 hypothetical protein FOE74_01840 [Rufibacter glacialis]GGK60601.1 hypothetical protein GCM10011405_06040 [Rufibacter glacialis]